MQNSSTLKLDFPLAVVAHDAGAANLIVGWLRGQLNFNLRICLDGPAIELWKAVFGETQITPLNDALDGASMLLSGTSYLSELEHQARLLAKNYAIHSIGVIDHWVNYNDRFIRNGIKILPDEIWVADEYAYSIARNCFPDIDIRNQPNFYLDELMMQIKSVKNSKHIGESFRILCVQEQIRHEWIDDGEAGEFQALDYFFQNLSKLGFDGKIEIRIRPHPSDTHGKYENWVAKHNDWNLKIDYYSSLADSIAWANVVVGCESYALVVALTAGRIVISSLPPQAPLSRLPMKGIINLRDILL